MKDVSSVMSRDTVMVDPGESVAEVARRMTDREVGVVLLREGDRLTGIFSERDLVTRVVAAGLDPATTAVGAVATRKLEGVSAEAPLEEAAAHLAWKHLRHLVVLDGEEAVGLVSMRALLAAVAAAR